LPEEPSCQAEDPALVQADQARERLVVAVQAGRDETGLVAGRHGRRRHLLVHCERKSDIHPGTLNRKRPPSSIKMVPGRVWLQPSRRPESS